MLCTAALTDRFIWCAMNHTRYILHSATAISHDTKPADLPVIADAPSVLMEVILVFQSGSRAPMKLDSVSNID
jgi:hypothetical protein